MGPRGRNLAFGLACAAILGVVAACSLAAGMAGAMIARAAAPPLAAARAVSTEVVDRNGRLLRAFATQGGAWRLPAEAARVDRRYLAMLLAYEDGRFRQHRGVDPLALARAAWQLARSGRIVSGGSTITMQAVRLLRAREGRDFGAKLDEMAAALALERALSKDEILSLYLTLAPFGGNLEGVRAASLAYFGKEPARLSVAEAALLVALPQSPERRRPDRFPDAARAARDRVLDRMVAAGVVDPGQAEAANAAPVPRGRRAMPILAAHAAEAALRADRHAARHVLTIDRPLQERLEALARERATALGPGLSAAIVVVENETGHVLAHVGSADFLDASRRGQVDMASSVRSPGSTLKPFIYALAFERGLAHPQTLIEDKPTRFGLYAPRNFQDDYHGTVSVAQALQSSLNVPAVALLDALGPARLKARLGEAGAVLHLPQGEAPGLAVALGGVGLTLSDLAMLYAGLARGGEAMPLATVAADAPPAPRRLVAPAAAWAVTDILAGTLPPDNAAGGRIAYKTGTSYGYRDAWAVGFDGRHTVAVWVGRPDGAPVAGLVGREAAAPVLFAAYSRIAERRAPLRPPSPAIARTMQAQPSPPLARFHVRGLRTRPGGAEPVRIAYPPDGARVELAGSALALKAEGGRPPLAWFVDGRPVTSDRRRRQSLWQPQGPGFVRLSVVDADGHAASATVRLE